MSTGYLSLLLHTHLPFVKHPEYDDFLEEDWLFEAITECYVPLLMGMSRMHAQGTPFRVTCSLTPPLCEMLADELLRGRYLRHLRRLMELIRLELERTAGTAFHSSAQMYAARLAAVEHFYDQVCGRDLLAAFNRLRAAGRLEIITCAATHGFLPFIREPSALNAQIAVAVANYKKHFSADPPGIWLPECGYFPGLDALLAKYGIRYFIIDTHGMLFGDRFPKHGIHAPVRTPSGVCAFARDVESGRSVWSSESGYPGHADYREFYRDLGYDADYSYIKPFLHSDGVRRNVGIKYHRVTGKVELHHKAPYDRPRALATAGRHAARFCAERERAVISLAAKLGRAPIVVSPYDAELFGHWWFEGPEFLRYVIERATRLAPRMQLISPGDYLDKHPDVQNQTPAASTWGDQGYHSVWLNGTNDWIYPHQHEIERRMAALARKHRRPTALQRRALNQCARELLLAQSSDWAFIMSNETTVPYAHKRFKTHVHRFLKLEKALGGGNLEESELALWETADSIFPEIDYRVYET